MSTQSKLTYIVRFSHKGTPRLARVTVGSNAKLGEIIAQALLQLEIDVTDYVELSSPTITIEQPKTYSPQAFPRGRWTS